MQWQWITTCYVDIQYNHIFTLFSILKRCEKGRLTSLQHEEYVIENAPPHMMKEGNKRSRKKKKTYMELSARAL